MRIGVDLDNTIICYDNLFHACAREKGLIPQRVSVNKAAVSAHIRLLKNGEEKWQELQSVVYGRELHRAALKQGVELFLSACVLKNIPVFVVSHKTKYSAFGNVDLRGAAVKLLEAKEFFSRDGLGLSRDRIFFESTRREKIDRIATLNLSCFIDDLPKVLLHEDFPKGVTRILYSEKIKRTELPEVVVINTWEKIKRYLCI